MILGVFRDGHPRITLTLPGQSGPVSVEFIVDTGFDGHLCVPGSFAHQLASHPSGFTDRMMADGSIVRCPYYYVAMNRSGEQTPIQVLVLPGPLLMGTEFLREHLLQIEMTEGGEVTAEPL